MSVRNGRTRARRAALQAIYQWQLNQQSGSAILSEFVADRELVNVDLPHFEILTREIPRHAEELAADLAEFLELPWHKITLVERAALLIGAYELKHCRHVPYRVAINEAVELVKLFGAEEGYRFVNGVLDRYARRVRADETTPSALPSGIVESGDS